MERKKYLYAAIGAPVAIIKQARDRLDDLRGEFGDRTSKLGDEARERIEGWATEGEEFVGKLTESEAIDELTSRMDLDQVQEQVSKLREQLEDLLATWRTNFRPERAGQKAETPAVTAPTEKAPAAKKAPAKKAPAKKPAAKTAPAKKAPAKKAPAKTEKAATPKAS